MRIGIIGTGRIASRFLTELGHVEGATASAVFNPHTGSAEKFVGKIQDSVVETMHNAVRGLSLTQIPEAYNELEAFWEKVDAVYIASPHETHYTYTLQALEHGKHVLSEKPFSFSESEVKKVGRQAKSKKLVFMEALKTAYMPGFKQLIEVAYSGIIGDIVQVNSTFTKLVPEDSRELTGEKAGSFIELGSYGMLATFSLLGTNYKAVHFDSLKNEKGIDIYTVAHFDYGCAFATATAGLGVKSEGSLVVSGTKGYITVSAPWWLTKHFEVHFEDPNKIISYENDLKGDGLRYEITEFIKKINAEEIGKDEKMEDISLKMAATFEKFLKK